MQTIKRLFNFYIFSSIHVALGVFCFVKLTLKNFGVEENITALFCFFSTILSYNFIRFLNESFEKDWLSNWYRNHKSLLVIISFISAIIVLYLSFSFRIESLMILLPFFILTLFYGMKLPRKLVTLRRVPGLKIFLIAFCFAGVTVLFPLVQNEIDIDVIIWWFFLQRMFFVILITLPFDIRDVDFDSDQLRTIPQQFGHFTTKLLGLILILGIFTIELFIFGKEFNEMFILLTICSLSFVLLLFSRKEQSKYYSAFWVEAIPIFWLLLLLGLNF
ncbi:hypothetical protein [Urechidicola vernalis]|uniref:Prenyltransferase n=1 Tax=Urechidicola vernalis TaxID=3075600 RepID=A0ABU2Y2E3_9FLAO|nr:hypothetical protein [Urechidicola sp. P050]MDT0552379.1 hypothetical protein [Urechidicola sp. P050]